MGRRRVSAAPTRVRRFGPGALATPANAITVARIVLAVPTLFLIADRGSGWTTVGLWFVLSCTDGLDGWVARRYGTTRSGAFLDPVADKFLALGGFVALVSRGDVWWLPVALMAAREVAVSVYRSAAGRRGVVVPARNLGKAKTFLQLLTIGGYLLPWTAGWHGLLVAMLWGSVALTLVSGVEIARRGRQPSSA